VWQSRSIGLRVTGSVPELERLTLTTVRCCCAPQLSCPASKEDRMLHKTNSGESNFHYILGVRFFSGDARQALERMRSGGLLVVPAAPALVGLRTSAAYRDALVASDLAIADSGFMVVLWNLLQRTPIRKLSGLAYMREFVKLPELTLPRASFWVMADQKNAETNASWLRSQGVAVDNDSMYIAPRYGDEISDEVLLRRLNEHRPQHVVLTLGGGTQERLGAYLKRNVGYRPAIHCIGAAIAFLSGNQVLIPEWVDRAYLGWLWRCVSNPRLYVPRYWAAWKLAPLLWTYRNRLPVPENHREAKDEFGA